MNSPTDFDIGPLTWVKSEIDLALERADKALQQYTTTATMADGAGDLTQLRFCRTHLHQVQGALTIVGLDGVTQFSEAMESLLEAMEAQQCPAEQSSIELVQRTMAAVRHYLDDILGGQPNQPLRLLPLYRELQLARGQERVRATDLFFPNLQLGADRRSAPPLPLSRSDRERSLRQQRAHFQRGLLSWLRAPKNGAGLAEMLDAVKRIEAIHEMPSGRAFWWVAAAFLTALAEGSLPVDADARQLCTRIDLQIRRLLEGSSNVAERLMRDALYLVGIATSDHRRVRRVKEVYQLAALIPGAAPAAPVALESVRRRLREAVTATEESWNKFCAGTTQALPAFRANATTLAAVVDELGHRDYHRLADVISEVAGLLGQTPSRHNEALAMETATAILLAQNAQENIQYLDQSFSHQVDVMVARLRGCLAGVPPQPGSEIPSLDEMSRLAQEKLLVGQVAREIQNNLAQIEQVLDGFFRDADKPIALDTLETPLKQVIGALMMMRHDGAVAVLQQCASDIKVFATPDYVPQETDFSRVAERLALVGFFIDALHHGADDFDNFVANMQSRTARQAAVSEPAATVEAELEQQKRETHGLLAALKEQPTDAGLLQEVQQNLVALQKDADLIADKALGQQTKEVLSALAAGGDAAQQIDEALATLQRQAPEAPQPSAATLQLSQATSEEVDAELLGIFLEEADEVLASMDRNYHLLKAAPHDSERLTALRRSVHTLKGSGRMVGLKDLGEAAWAVEQVLNLWLRQEQEVTPAVLDLLSQTYAVFIAWVEHLKTGTGAAPDPSPMVALADALRLGSESGTAMASVPPVGEAIAAPSEQRVPATATTTAETVSLPPAAVERTRLTLAGDLAEIFAAEAKAHLATLESEFVLLEGEPLAPTRHEMYRAAHTLAGTAATVGLVAVNRLGQALEHALLRRKQAVHPDSSEALELIRQTIAFLAMMLADVAHGHEPEAAPTLVEALAVLYQEQVVEPVRAEASTPLQSAKTPAPGAESATIAASLALPLPQLQDEIDEQLLPLFIEEALELNQNIAAQLRAWRSNPDDSEVVRKLSRLFHTLKGSARMAGAMNLGELTHAIETRMEEAQRTSSAPPELIDDIDSAFDVIVQTVDSLQRGESPDALVEVSDDTVTRAEAVLVATVEGESTRAEQPAGGRETPEAEADTVAQRAILRVRADLVDRLVNEAGELSIARSRIEGEMRAIKGSLLDLTENVIRLRRQLRDIELHAELQMQSRAALTDETHADFDPLEFDRFTRFQELTRMMAESVNDVATAQQSLLKNLDDANAAILAQSRLNRDLQQELMSIRMVPFASIADRLYRIVRQATKEIGKRANLEISGAEIELDRTVLDKMLAPLEHMLRNAIAHGLERAPVRAAKGKPEIGELALSLAHEGNEVILTFSDDGAGLDLERLRERGLAAGLLSREDALDPARVQELIFAPGISTANEVSRLSGRGIGMDVLKSEVASLGGRIEVVSTAGQGTTFRLYLPLTLAVTKALLVRSGKREYAIPAAMIEQVLDLREKGLARIRDAHVATWSGNAYAFHYLPHLLGDTHALPQKHQQYWVLLLRSGTGRIALQVDSLLGNQEIVVKNVGPQLARVIGVDGATVLGNGQVVLILNPVALASRSRGIQAVSPVPTLHQPLAPDSVTATLPTIMVVDDSLTVRKITSRLLARENYQIMTAKDGIDALEQLIAIVPDVMLVDIEMPRMDGYELTRNVRADKRLHAVPIIMITSRTAEKHRQYAFELGVNHYLGKPYQEDELLRLIAQHVREQRQP